MKQWPENGGPADLEELVSSLRSALTTFYELERTKKRSAKWQGPEITATRILCVSNTIAQQLQKGGLDYDGERGRDPLDVVLRCAIQLGIEQGLRWNRQDLETHSRMVKEVTLPALAEISDALDAGNLEQARRFSGVLRSLSAHISHVLPDADQV